MQTRRKAHAVEKAGSKRETVKPKRATQKHRRLSSGLRETRGQQKEEKAPPRRRRKSVAHAPRKTRAKKDLLVEVEKRAAVPQSEASQVANTHETEKKEIEDKIRINRAPVLTLWVTVVAMQEGFTYEEGLSFGKNIAGLMAQSKGRRLGLYEEPSEEKKEQRKRKRAELDRFSVFGMNVPGKKTQDGLRLAVQRGKPISPVSVENYLRRSFGPNVERVKRAMVDLANSFPPEEIGRMAYSLYEKFRPTVAHGTKGWGAKGFLDLESMRALRRQ